MRLIFLTLAWTTTLTRANVFLHSPRGSNNRLNERSAARVNPQRLFFSNNNDRGGYNVGDKTDVPFTDEQGQYAMKYFQSSGRASGASYLTVEWTNSLGCGVDEDGDRVQNCQIVLQTMCQKDSAPDSTRLRNGKSTETRDFTGDAYSGTDPAGACYIDAAERDLSALHTRIPKNEDNGSIQWCRNHCEQNGFIYAAVQFHFECFCGNHYGRYGLASDQNECNRACEDDSGDICGGPWRSNIFLSADRNGNRDFASFREVEDRRAKSSNPNLGLHESWDFYDRCNSTGRNTRHGFECPQERQVWPAAEISPWNDVAVFTDEPESTCDEYNELHQKPYYECVEFYNVERQGEKLRRHKSTAKTEQECAATPTGQWLAFYKYHAVFPYTVSKTRCNQLISRAQRTAGKLRSRAQKAARFPSYKPTQYHWGRPMIWEDLAANRLTPEQCFMLPTPVECHRTPNTRQNYLGNDEHGESPRFKWRLPTFRFGSQRCVMRLRYLLTGNNEQQITFENKDVAITKQAVSADDPAGKCYYDHGARDLADRYIEIPDGTGSIQWCKNYCKNEGFVYAGVQWFSQCFCGDRFGEYGESESTDCHTPCKDDSGDMCGGGWRNNIFMSGLEEKEVTLPLAVPDLEAVDDNVVVFEDRSHVFELVPRPVEIGNGRVLHNIVVRGKRGNIVQTFPAVEYDFVPNRLSIREGEAVQVHWTGSNTHNNGGPAGDGQAGDAGEGRRGTDRHNFVQLADLKMNFPMPYENHTIFEEAEWLWSSHEKGSGSGYNLALSYTTGGYYQCRRKAECERGYDGFEGAKMNERFDNVNASFGGNVFVPKKGEYHYMCLRNNNFSNRSQKGSLLVT